METTTTTKTALVVAQKRTSCIRIIVIISIFVLFVCACCLPKQVRVCVCGCVHTVKQVIICILSLQELEGDLTSRKEFFFSTQKLLEKVCVLFVIRINLICCWCVSFAERVFRCYEAARACVFKPISWCLNVCLSVCPHVCAYRLLLLWLNSFPLCLAFMIIFVCIFFLFVFTFFFFTFFFLFCIHSLT